MSYKTRLSTALILSAFLLSNAFLIWAYQTGKISIFGSTQNVSDFSAGQPDSNVDLSSGIIQLKNQAGGYVQSGSYISSAIGGDNVKSFENFIPDAEARINLLKNPSFETAGDAEHPNADWMMIESSQGVIGASAAAATGIPVTRETGGSAHSGNAYAKMNDTSPTYSMNLAQLVPVTSGKLYVATAYLNEVLTSAPSYGNDTYLTMGFFGNDFSTTPEGVKKHIGISRTPFNVYKSMGGWTQTQAMAVAPEGATQVSIAITSMNPHTGAIYIDDVAVYEMPDGLNKVNIKNPSFETAGDAEHPNADWMMIESSQGVIGASAAAATGIPVTRETGGFAHSGNAYAKMNDTSPTYSMNLAQLVPVTSGKLYVATAYLNEVLTSAPSYGNDTYLTMGFFGNDFSTTPEGVIKHIGISRTPFDVYKSMGGWTQTQAMAVAPEGATQVSIAITSMTAHTGAIYIDDVGLYEASTGLSILAKSADLTSAEAQPSKITYQFRGSTNNSSWSNWSQPQTPSSPIALSGLISGDSKYLQAKMNLSSSNNEQTPAINSFSVNYNTTGTAGSSLAGSVGSLVASGSVLWVNILIALVISGAIMWFLLRRKTT